MAFPLLDSVFVYGTLCQGQRNEHWWPHTPLRIEPAFTRGRLFDLGAYPALIPGRHLVRGELWTLTMPQMDSTLAALDELEGYRGQADDLYRRVVCECRVHSRTGRTETAFTYHFLAELPEKTEICPDKAGVCIWISK